jgi:hypothetical protein
MREKLKRLPLMMLIAAMLPSSVTIEALAESSGRIPKPRQGVHLMPTKDCRQKRISDNEILIEHGGMLVKTTRGEVIISAMAGDEKIMTAVNENSLVLVHTEPNAVAITTFVSNHDSDVAVYLSRKEGKPYELHVPIGSEADIFHKSHPALPFSLLMAQGSRMAQQQIDENGMRIHTFRFDYPRAIRHYQLAKSLPAKDYERLLHHASVATMFSGR